MEIWPIAKWIYSGGKRKMSNRHTPNSAGDGSLCPATSQIINNSPANSDINQIFAAIKQGNKPTTKNAPMSWGIQIPG